MTTSPPNSSLTEDEVNRRIWQWAELTSQWLEGMETEIRSQHPDLSDQEVHAKMAERLNKERALKWGGLISDGES